MFRSFLTFGFLSVFALSGSGCYCCGWMPPCALDGPYFGCVDAALCGGPRTTICERRELRRALRHSRGCSVCPSCHASGFIADGQCSNCQQQVPMSTNYQMSQPIPEQGMMMSPSSPNVPQVPAAPSSPNPTPSPTNSSQVQPMSGQYPSGQYYNPPQATFLPGVQQGRPIQ